MNCREFVEFILEYHDGRLEANQRKIFEKHIADCPPCGVYLDHYEQVIRLEQAACDCDDPTSDEPPAEMPEKLVQAILAARRNQRSDFA